MKAEIPDATESEYLTELGGELMIDFIESATKSGELLASLVGDKELSHALPIDVLGWLERDIGELPDQVSIHSRFLSSTLSLQIQKMGPMAFVLREWLSISYVMRKLRRDAGRRLGNLEQGNPHQVTNVRT